MNSNLQDEIKNFIDNRIWMTKKSRMEAEARMNKNNIFSQFLVNYYTFVVLAFSIISLLEKNSDIIALMTVIASVGLFGTTLFLTSMAYKEKAMQYKDSYLSLTELETDLKHILREDKEDSEVINNLQILERRYNEILAKTDNHSEVDYIKVQLKISSKIDKANYWKYLIHNTTTFLFKVILISVPFALIFLYFRYK
ncbi:SLATT domain-containing protein [Paenibacillus sp. 2003]|uniref:SLATT domain-containing protein n=1 Tax=Paenibacillus TaxID=44249 RepID=UPI00285974DB|nr:SLATT domain-containing protein [Paenibacillus sp. 2003]MDR6720111.1 hypothetical protein [Paenibacillus sp. 2003]